MISGVSSSYSSYAAYSSTQRSTPPSANCAGGPEKMQEKLFSLLDSNSDGSVAKDELATALTSAKESDSSLTIDIDELFSQLDTNGDGSLDTQETAALAPPPPRGPNPEEMFATLDANADGSIDAEELSALPAPPGADSSALLAELDSDGDGALNLDELSAMAPPPPPAQNATNSDELFTRFDADSSGNISQDELSSLLEAVAQQTPSRTGSQEDADSGLIAKLLKQYQDGAGYRTSVGSQVNISA